MTKCPVWVICDRYEANNRFAMSAVRPKAEVKSGDWHLPQPLWLMASPGTATFYDKLAANDLAFVQLASIRLWLRVNESRP